MNVAKMMKNLQKMQTQMQTEIDNVEVEASSGGGVVTVGMFLESRKWTKKDIIKIEHKELTQAEADKIALLGPHTTISIIRDYRVVEKRASAIPERIVSVVRCPNPACITNHDQVPTDFHELA